MFMETTKNLGLCFLLVFAVIWRASSSSADKVTEAPDKVTQAPDEVTQAADKVTQAPDEVTQTTEKVTQATFEITQAPNPPTEKDKVTQAPDKVTQAADKVTQAPDEVTQATEKVTQVTYEITQAPNPATEKVSAAPEVVNIRLGLHLPFTTELEDTKSAASIKLASGLEKSLFGIMKKTMPELKEVKTKSFKNGSVIADVEAVNDEPVEPSIRTATFGGLAAEIKSNGLTVNGEKVNSDPPQLLILNQDGSTTAIVYDGPCSLYNAMDTCENGGVCKVNQANSAFCRCSNDYIGDYCETDKTTVYIEIGIIAGVGGVVLLTSVILFIATHTQKHKPTLESHEERGHQQGIPMQQGSGPKYTRQHPMQGVGHDINGLAHSRH